MRYIDNLRFVPPKGWAQKVKDALLHYQLTGEFKNIWSDIATDLNSIVRRDKQIKCWYSEIIVLGSEADVDHFRPKSNCKGLTKKFADLDQSIWDLIDHSDKPGYPFLAFEWINFRLASKHSNQGRVEGYFTKGKQDFFPLRLASFVATSIIDLDNESICLLDPCKPNDPELLKFDNTGLTDALHPKGTWEYCRAKISIEIYHLNFNLKGLVDARLQKWNECSREIEFLMKLYSTKKMDLVQEQQRKIMRLAKKESEFSAVVIDCIRHHATQDQYFYIKPLAKALCK